jgi:hypothetical protein
MDLSSRWDHSVITVVLFFIIVMTGCQGLSGGSSSSKPTGALLLGSANLDFGTVVVGSSKNLTDTLTNGTRTSVAISSATASDPQFKIVSPSFPMMLSPGQSVMLTLSFTPTAAGKPAGKLALAGGPNGEIDVAVAGSAVAAGKLVVSPASIAFGSVRLGQTQAKTASLTNSGDSSITIAQASANNAAFTFNGLALPVTLIPGQTTSFNVVFAPKAAGQVSGSVSMQGQASLVANAAAGQSGDPSIPTTAAITVSGSGAGTSAGQLTLTPSSVSFGSVTVGSSQSQSVTLTNNGGTSAMVSAASASGTGFGVSGLALPLTLASGQSTSFKVTFAPKQSGAGSGSVTVSSNASDSTLTGALTGTGASAGALTLNPASLSFGNVAIGIKQNQTGSLSNTGGTSLTVSQATVTGAAFTISGLNLPLTLAPGQTAGFTATFTPQGTGSSSGSIAFSGTAPTETVTLAGSGLASGSLAANPASVSFGSVRIGSPQSQTITLKNGGTTPATLSSVAASGSGFSLSGIGLPTTVQAGQTVSFSISFSPASAGNATGSITVLSNAANPTLSIPLSGAGVTIGALAANQTSISFSGVAVGSTQTKSEVISNSGGSPVTISNATLTGTGFASSGLSVPMTLNGGQSLTFSITFTPQSSATVTGGLALTATGSVPDLSIALSGSGSSPGTLSVTPATVNFGNVTVGANQTQTATLSSVGSGVTISSAASNNPEFTLSGLTLPVTLSAGQSAAFTLTFRPQASGATSGSISFASNATNAPVAESVTGTGTAAVQHSVSLSWTASTSTVVGYKMYRGTQSGGPYGVITTAPDPSTSYTDSTVQAGQTYYYVVTAVDAGGNESVYSNQAQAVIPTP